MRQKALAKKMEKLKAQLEAENNKEQSEAIQAQKDLKQAEDRLAKMRRAGKRGEEIKDAEIMVKEAQENYDREQAEADEAKEKLLKANGGQLDSKASSRRPSTMSVVSELSDKSDQDSVASPSSSDLTADSTAKTDNYETGESDEGVNSETPSPTNSVQELTRRNSLCHSREMFSIIVLLQQRPY